MNRYRVIDRCRGLLFVLMMNTHALTLADVPHAHWLFSDLWLPNGWATVVFVVLSGYGVGYVFSPRPSIEERDQALRHRSLQIFAVMLVSNTVFAALKQVSLGNSSILLSPNWWLGFITLTSEWTISGVLLPTGLVVLCGPWIIRWTQRAPWGVLLALALARLSMSVLVVALSTPALIDTWLVRFFFTEGLGGFPVLPFVVNGCIGIWLGMLHHRSENTWRIAMGLLLAFQLLIYLSIVFPEVPYEPLAVSSIGAVSKFAWMMLITYLCAALVFQTFTSAIELLGRYALCSFILHRVFLHAIDIGFRSVGFIDLSSEIHYVVLFIGVLFMTWALCAARRRHQAIDTFLKRIWL